jgi:hypothetical protein
MPLDWIHYIAVIVIVGALVYILALRRSGRARREFISSSLKDLKAQLDRPGNERLLTIINSMIIALGVTWTTKRRRE